MSPTKNHPKGWSCERFGGINIRVMVTGSKGFLGKSVIHLLQESNWDIVHFDLQDGDDILDYQQVISKLQNSNLCIHLAAVADVYDAEADAERCQMINVEGTRNIAKACVDTDVRLLFISTVCAYGNNGNLVQTEDSPLAPTEIYAETKAEAESILSSIENLDYRIIRPATFYGSGMRDTLAIQRFINASKNGRKIEIHGNGTQTRCYTHVDDVALSIMILSELWPDDIVYNVANPQPTSVIELVEMIRQVSGENLEIQHVEDRRGQIFCSSIDVSKMKSLGWAPTKDLLYGIKELFS